ncbi:hypothetical protein S40288_07772, partial [Stachybotrys chartarum IBT 40288]
LCVITNQRLASGYLAGRSPNADGSKILASVSTTYLTRTLVMSCQSAPATRLPVELWLAVAESADIADLSALSTLNRWFRDALTPQLYRRAAVTPFDKRALFWGVLKGLRATVQQALAAGIDPNLRWRSLSPANNLVELFDDQGGTKPDIELADFLRAIEYVCPAESDHVAWRWSALHLAARNGDVDMIELLLNHQANPLKGSLGVCRYIKKLMTAAARYPLGETYFPRHTPLFVAVWCGHLPVVQALVSRGVPMAMEEPSRHGETGITALHVACMSGHLHVVKWLLDRGGPVDLVDAEGHTPLVYAHLYEKQDCFDYLLGLGANINHVVSGTLDHEIGDGTEEEWIHETILYSAVYHSRLKAACELIDRGAAAQTGDPSNYPLMHLLCKNPWTRVIAGESQQAYGVRLMDHLLSVGLPPDETNRRATPLNYAASAGNDVAVKRLLEAGANVDGCPDAFASPLAAACQGQPSPTQWATARILVEAGACVDKPGNTCLAPLWALDLKDSDEPEKKEMYQLLLQRGACPSRNSSSASGIISYTTPLEGRLKQRDLAGFEALLASCGPNPLEKLGDDDFLGFWKAAVKSEDETILTHVLRLDQRGVVAKMNQQALSDLFRLMPMSNDLILRLLEQGANEHRSMFGMGTLVEAVSRAAEPKIIKELLARGSDPDELWQGQTLISYILSRRDISQERQLAYVQILMDAGVSIYQIIDKPLWHPASISPTTHLADAIQGMSRDQEIVEYMLRKQPLHDHEHVRVSDYIQWCCGTGNWKALQAMLVDDYAKLLLGQNCTALLHHAMDGLRLRQLTVKEMDETISMVQFLLQHDSDLDTVGEGPRDPRTLREKLRSVADSKGCRADPTGWCFQRRMEFEDGQDLPVFKDAGPLENGEQSLYDLGRSLGGGSGTASSQ